MTLLRSARLLDGTEVDVRLEDGAIEAVAAAGTLPSGTGEKVHDLRGYLLLPAPVEPHAHLDKALSGARVTNRTGDLEGAIEAWRAYRALCPVSDLRERAGAGARAAIGFGATAIRSHADVGEGIELRAVEALIEVRDSLAGSVPLQVVALASFPLTGPEGRENRAFLRGALEMGADLVGGAPAVDPDPPGCIDVCLDTAVEFGRPLDLHMDETLERSSLWLEELARRVVGGFPTAVTASHCVSLGIQPPDVQVRVASKVAEVGISVVTLPLTNLYLQGRGWGTSPPRALTAIRTLLDCGVLVAGGGDNVQDVFNPLGRGDPVETAALLVAAGHLGPQEAWSLVAGNARAVLGLPAVEVAPGFPADLLAVAASSLPDALATMTEDRVVYSAGRLVARTRVDREVAVDLPGAASVLAPAAGLGGGGPGWR